MLSTVTAAVSIGLAAAVSIALWTFRVALAGRGRRGLSAIIAGLEAMLFVTIFTGLISHLGDPVRLGGYALGVTVGTFLGLAADERLSRGQSEVRLVVPGDATPSLERLHRHGWPATATAGVGPDGPAASLFVAVDDRRLKDLLAVVDRLEPAPFVTVERLRAVRPTPLPAGFVQVGGGVTARPRRAVLGRRSGAAPGGPGRTDRPRRQRAEPGRGARRA
jgi:uncharacterized protein YebE (UPF0316 family)